MCPQFNNPMYFSTTTVCRYTAYSKFLIDSIDWQPLSQIVENTMWNKVSEPLAD